MQRLAGVFCRTIEASVPSERVLPRTEGRTRQELPPVWLCLTQHRLGGEHHQPPNFQSSHSGPAPTRLTFALSYFEVSFFLSGLPI